MFQVSAVQVSLDNLASLSDIVVVSASLNESTKHIVNRDFLKKMKNSGYLINISRGALVDQEALVEALNEGEIRGMYNISTKIFAILQTRSWFGCVYSGAASIR